jgi:hypothetical protein
MKEPGASLKRFHLGIGSVFAGLLLFGGFESLIRTARDPIVRAVIRLLNRFVNSDALRLRETSMDWPFLLASLVVGLIFIVCGLVVGARVLKKKLLATSS